MAKLDEIQLCEKLVLLEKHATKQGIPFSLSMRQLKKLINKKRCEYSRRKFPITNVFSKAFDRYDYSKGFTDENTLVCLTKYKEIRKDSVRDLKRVFKNILLFKGKK